MFSTHLGRQLLDEAIQLFQWTCEMILEGSHVGGLISISLGIGKNKNKHYS